MLNTSNERDMTRNDLYSTKHGETVDRVTNRITNAYLRERDIAFWRLGALFEAFHRAELEQGVTGPLHAQVYSSLSGKLKMPRQHPQDNTASVLHVACRLLRLCVVVVVVVVAEAASRRG